MMRSRLLATSALVLALVLSGCGTGTAPALSVGGTSVSHADLDRDVDAMLARPSFFAGVFGICPTAADPNDGGACPEIAVHAAGTYPQAVATFAIRQRIFFTQVRNELESRGVQPSAADRDFVNEALGQAGPDGRTLLELLVTDDAASDEAFVSSLVDDFAAQVALQNLFPDEAAFSAALQQANAAVEVNGRYGTWDPVAGVLEPPAGSVATKTSAPVGFPS